MVFKNIKKLYTLIIFLFVFIIPKASIAWGAEGHTIVVRLAIQFVKEDVRMNVLNILGKMPIDTAANWMDSMRSNGDYDFMKPWHQINISRGQDYKPTTDENIVNRLMITYNELKHKNTLCAEQIKTDVLVLMHLMGDLHTPLHAGYDDDIGGNRIMIQYDTMKTHNLHKFWDEDIIRLTHITFEDCIQLYRKAEDIKIDTMGSVDFVKWMKETRNLLGDVYNYSGFTLTGQYLNKHKLTVERQLLLAGIRLANILNKLFYTPAPLINTNALTAEYTNGVAINDVAKYIGKKVTICARIYGIRSTEKITQINLGDKFPNNPLTVVIFASSYKNFKGSLEDLFKDKNVCVKGKVEQYKGKTQIIVEQPADIIVQ